MQDNDFPYTRCKWQTMKANMLNPYFGSNYGLILHSSTKLLNLHITSTPWSCSLITEPRESYVKIRAACEITDSHSGDDSNKSLPVCNTPVLWHDINVLEDLAVSIFRVNTSRQQGPPKHCYPTTTLNSISTHKTSTWIRVAFHGFVKPVAY